MRNPIYNLRLLRVAALIAILVGAIGSEGFMFQVGHRNKSLLLMTLFAIWVLSPFLPLAWAYVISRSWSVFAQAMLFGLTLVLALASLVIYGEVALGPPRAKPAFFFLVLPLVSWLLTAMCVAMAVLRMKKTIKPR